MNDLNNIKFGYTFTDAYDGEDCDDPDYAKYQADWYTCLDEMPVRVPRHSVNSSINKKINNKINASLLIKNKMQYLNEINLADNKLTESISIKNNFIALFIAEVLSKSIQENWKDKRLFQYIWDIKISLNSKSKINEKCKK